MKKRRTPRVLVIGLLVIVAGALAVWGFTSIRNLIKTARNEQAFQEAKSFLVDNRPAKAFEIIRMRDRSIPDKKEKWLHLEIETLNKLGNIGRLGSLFERHPEAFIQHEEASMMIARSLLATGDMKAYAALRQSWESRKTRPELWFAIDVDALIMQGDAAGALKMLQSRSFEGEADAARLCRLALLTAGKNLQEAWLYLEQAFLVAPKNPDVRSFRAQILERMGKQQMARVEYVAAHLAAPGNPLYRDQLAEFYRRYGQLGLAVQTWSSGLDERSADFIRLKAIFWSKVATPAPISRTDPSNISGELGSFVIYLQDLPDGRFWDDALFKKNVTDRQTVLEQRQEAYWLRVLQALKNGEEKQAYDLILSHPFKKTSWNPDIENGLEQVLAYRLGQTQPIDAKDFLPAGRSNTGRHQLFDQLGNMAKTGKPAPDLHKLLLSKEAFAAVFMAGGWMEAALNLNGTEFLTNDLPDWVAYGMTQSMRFTRGTKEALAFARKQRQTPVMDLLTAELLLASGEPEAGMARLDTLAGMDSGIGYRAAWLLTLAHLDRKAIDKALTTLDRQPGLRDSITGKEIQARIMLSEGKKNQAREIYTSLASQSTEAQAYLAKLAYQEKDWKTARTLTMALLKAFPDNMQLRANLNAISKAEMEKTE
jgi:hypothetical protein